MTSGQTRVLVLLIVLLGLDVTFNPTLRANLIKGASTQDVHTFASAYLGLGLGGVALVALAAPAPKVATYIAIAFILIVLLKHSDAWAGMLGKASANLQALTGSAAASPANPTSAKK